jgi:hypothetical protein
MWMRKRMDNNKNNNKDNKYTYQYKHQHIQRLMYELAALKGFYKESQNDPIMGTQLKKRISSLEDELHKCTRGI